MYLLILQFVRLVKIMSIHHNLLIHPVGWEVSLGKGHSPISHSPSWGIFTANHERLWMTKIASTGSYFFAQLRE
jgi:hypothetical protein